MGEFGLNGRFNVVGIVASFFLVRRDIVVWPQSLIELSLVCFFFSVGNLIEEGIEFSDALDLVSALTSDEDA